MGNRGILHDDNRQIVRRWATKSWVACDPTFRGISRKPLFSPRTYSELFFLDEATALSAGHRPCAYCRRERFNAFKDAWRATSPVKGSTLPAREIDEKLHAQRVSREAEKVTFQTAVGPLPDGSIFENGDHAFLLHRGRTWRWSFLGYEHATSLPPHTEVRVLTPESVVRLYSAGYTPGVHSTAEG
jgi:hypothetical protein